MTQRLKDIWAGFADVTERRLTGKGVDNIPVPHRADYGSSDNQFLPEQYESPADRAFAVLRADLKAKEKKFSKKASRVDTPSASAPDEIDGEKAWGSDDLNVGLWSTAMRVERSELDYGRFMTSNAGKKALKRTKKKRFGIF